MVKVEVDYFGRSIGDVVAGIKEGIAREIVLPEATHHLRRYGQRAGRSVRRPDRADHPGPRARPYMVMAAQFESLIDPFVIFLALPLPFPGVLLGLYAFDMTFNMFSFIGIILLVGTGINNGIINLVDYINTLRAR